MPLPSSGTVSLEHRARLWLPCKWHRHACSNAQTHAGKCFQSPELVWSHLVPLIPDWCSQFSLPYSWVKGLGLGHSWSPALLVSFLHRCQLSLSRGWKIRKKESAIAMACARRATAVIIFLFELVSKDILKWGKSHHDSWEVANQVDKVMKECSREEETKITYICLYLFLFLSAHSQFCSKAELILPRTLQECNSHHIFKVGQKNTHQKFYSRSLK
jgi:hypothetical protein